MIKFIYRVLNYLITISRVGFFSTIKCTFLSKLKIKKKISVKIDGRPLLIRTNTPDLGTALLSLGEEFEPLSYLFQKNYDNLIIDAGGYIGTSSIKFAELYPNATIITIEPSTENYNILIKNTEKYKNIKVIKAALVGKKSGELILHNLGTGEWGNTVVDKNLLINSKSINEVEKIRTITVEEILNIYKNKKIGLLKVDIEGAEKELLDNSHDVLSDIYATFIELHDRFVPGCTQSYKNFSRNRLLINFGTEKYLSVKK